MAGRGGRRFIGNALILIGVVLLLVVGGYYGWTQYRGQQLRAQLRRTPTVSAALATQTAIPSPAVTSTSTPVPVPTDTPETAQTPSIPAATAEPTALPPTTAPHILPTITGSPLPAPVGPPVRIVIPDLQIDAPVVDMGWQVVQTTNGLKSEWVIPEDEAGHHLNSAELGEQGNVVVSGHNNIHGRVFEPISQAWDEDSRQPVDDYTYGSDILDGRTIQLYNDVGQVFEYAITAFYRLADTGVPVEQRIDNARYMQPTSEARLTLITCWPPWNNTHRLIVIARPVDQPP